MDFLQWPGLDHWQDSIVWTFRSGFVQQYTEVRGAPCSLSSYCEGLGGHSAPFGNLWTFFGYLSWIHNPCRGGPYASLFDGNKMTTYVCNTLCAVYNIPTTQGKSIFFGAYMVFLWFHNHCKLALLRSEAQWSICEFCPTSLAGFLGFHMVLLVQDSKWIYLF